MPRKKHKPVIALLLHHDQTLFNEITAAFESVDCELVWLDTTNDKATRSADLLIADDRLIDSRITVGKRANPIIFVAHGTDPECITTAYKNDATRCILRKDISLLPKLFTQLQNDPLSRLSITFNEQIQQLKKERKIEMAKGILMWMNRINYQTAEQRLVAYASTKGIPDWVAAEQIEEALYSTFIDPPKGGHKKRPKRRTHLGGTL